MGTIKFRRLPGSTIVETIVALVVILVIFGIATTVFVQVSLHSFSVRKQQAAALINDYAVSTGEQHSFFNEEVTKDGLLLKKEVTGYPGNEQVTVITFEIRDSNNEILGNQKRLYRIK
jgi:Tfp pilus assembly protein PilE